MLPTCASNQDCTIVFAHASLLAQHQVPNRIFVFECLGGAYRNFVDRMWLNRLTFVFDARQANMGQVL
jgi:hypothetical protein